MCPSRSLGVELDLCDRSLRAASGDEGPAGRFGWMASSLKLFLSMTSACCLLSGCVPRTPMPKPEEIVGTWVASDGGRIQLTDNNRFVAEGIPECIISHQTYSRKRVSCEGVWELTRLSESIAPTLELIVLSRDDAKERSKFTLLTLEATWDWTLVGYLTHIDVGDAYTFKREGGK